MAGGRPGRAGGGPHAGVRPFRTGGARAVADARRCPPRGGGGDGWYVARPGRRRGGVAVASPRAGRRPQRGARPAQLPRPGRLRALPAGVWMEVGPYRRGEWLARGVAGGVGTAALCRVTDRSYLAVYETRHGAMWRLETTGRGTHHGLVAEGTADSAGGGQRRRPPRPRRAVPRRSPGRSLSARRAGCCHPTSTGRRSLVGGTTAPSSE